ncbi:MAG: hypothetical protein ABIP95_04470 [Pelobium sp.]
MKYSLLFILSIFIFSCSFNKEVKSSGELALQGKWEEDTVKNKLQLVSYQQHFLTFTCDSFYLQLHSYSTINLQGGKCYDAKDWLEFAKGYYKMAKDTLKMEGNFVNEDFKYKAEGSCYRTGKYIENFILTQQNDSTVILKSLQTGLSHQLLLKQKLTCNN